MTSSPAPLPLARNLEGKLDPGAIENWADLNGFIKGRGYHPCGFWVDTEDLEVIARALLNAAAIEIMLHPVDYEGSTPSDYELGWNAAIAELQCMAKSLE